jgi:hypothetical protein
MSEQDRPPTTAEIANVLRALVDGSMTRESAVRWASIWAITKADDVHDVRLLRTLERIASVDLVSTDRPYLYGKEDFTVWLTELLAK